MDDDDDLFYYSSSNVSMDADDYYGIDGSPFEGYEVTSNNPGYALLFATAGLSAFCILLGVILRCKKKKEEKKHGTAFYMDKIYTRYSEESANSKKRDKGMELLDLDHSKLDISNFRHNVEVQSIEKVNYANVVTRGRNGNIPTRRKKMKRMRSLTNPNRRGFAAKGRKEKSTSSITNDKEAVEDTRQKHDALYILELKEKGTEEENDDASMAASMVSAGTPSKTSPTKKGSHEGNDANHYEKMDDSFVEGAEDTSNQDRSVREEVKSVLELARPWAFGSFVENAASIITISIISHYIGTAEMIVYSYVWFIMDAGHIISNAMYSSLYKHANNAAALETAEGYEQAGKYIRVCCYCNFIFSAPICVGLVFSMGTIMKMFGYGEKIIGLTQNYTIIASVAQLVSTSTQYVSIVPDLDGNADFDAMYGLFDSIADIAMAVFVIPVLKPSLVQLGLIHLAQDILSLIIYYLITWTWKGWFDKYKGGIFGKLDLNGRDKKIVMSLLKKTVPLTFDAITAEIEWFVLTFFAAYLGAAEAAAWILISHIWGFVGILPENIASAAEYRVAHLLSVGQIHVAKKVASASMWITSFSSAVCCVLLFLFRNWIVDAVTQDEILDGMLLEIIPYVVLCDPIISISTAASSLNRALAMYKRSTKMELALTLLVTIPCAVVSTYAMGYNIEGIAASIYAGSAVMGFFSIVIFTNADWQKAAAKNKLMTGVEEEDSDEEDIDYGQLTIGSMFNDAGIV